MNPYFPSLSSRMVRFSVDGDGDEDGPSNNRPLHKRPRFSNPIVTTRRGPAAASNSGDRPTASNSGVRATATVSMRPEEPITPHEESEEENSSGEWETSCSHSSDYESEEEPQNQGNGNQAQSTEAPSGNGTFGEAERLSGELSVTLTDPDVLDCPICYEPLCSPVFQCENGHIACALCCNTMKNKCANCCWPIGYNRCRAIEKVLDSVKVPCRNKTYGCSVTLSYSKKQAHEKTCTHTPCSCPYIGCDVVARSEILYGHFSHQHSATRFSFSSAISILMENNKKHVFLQEWNNSTIFILNRSIETIGSFLNVVCVAPSLEKKGFLYELVATMGESSIKLKTSVEMMPKWSTQPPAKVRLLVPSDFTNVNGMLNLELTIWKNPPSARSTR